MLIRRREPLFILNFSRQSCKCTDNIKLIYYGLTHKTGKLTIRHAHTLRQRIMFKYFLTFSFV